MKATTLLKKEHALLRALFEEYDKATNAADRNRIVEELRMEITLHTEIEAEIFYPALADCGRDAIRVVDKARTGNERMETLLDDLETMPEGGDDFQATFAALRDAAEQHVRFEENGVFGLASRVFSDERMKELGDEMEFHKGSLLY